MPQISLPRFDCRPPAPLRVQLYQTACHHRDRRI